VTRYFANLQPGVRTGGDERNHLLGAVSVDDVLAICCRRIGASRKIRRTKLAMHENGTWAVAD